MLETKQTKGEVKEGKPGREDSEPHVRPFLISPDVGMHPAEGSTGPCLGGQHLQQTQFGDIDNADQIVPEIFQCSVSPTDYRDGAILPQSNGFVDTLVLAYNYHHKVVIRPDDVWITILSQFNLFVNANSDTLRSYFVSHKGKKQLVVLEDGTRYTVDFGVMAQRMTSQIEASIVDPTLKAWILPSFSTTTDNDTVVSAVLMMSTLQSYFAYDFMTFCGLPEVTLEGKKEDWEMLLDKLDRFDEFGEEPIQFAKCLRPILRRFVSAFEDPEGEENKDFWNRIYSSSLLGSGDPEYSGWITAFSFWDKDGKRQFDSSKVKRGPPKYDDFFPVGVGQQNVLELDGICYPTMLEESVTRSFASVPVRLIDNGAEFNATMVSGLVGTRATRDAVRPLAGWWIFEGDVSNWKEVAMRKDA
ncbi:hypothetical protein BT69DRAFT_1324985 [Atractiella rhizophila]|nr:hypothetical protein BT69DRAFT_1324985 [Atractiella rhizophila]